jgi:hypothetical protein
VGEHIPSHMVRIRPANPAAHWEPPSHGAFQAAPDPDGSMLVPKEHAAALIKRGGYVIVEEN